LSRSALFSLVAAILGVLAFAVTPVRALTVVGNGDTVDGWNIIMPAGMTMLWEDNKPSLTLQTTSAFNTTAGQQIMFVQALYSASSTITFDTQAITNSSFTRFTGMTQSVNTMLSGTRSTPALIGSAFTLNNPGKTIFTSQVTTGTRNTLSGMLMNTQTSRLGYGGGGNFIINANPATGGGLKKIFAFREDPIPVAPVPPAFWMGLSTLMGLGAVAGLRKMLGRRVA